MKKIKNLKIGRRKRRHKKIRAKIFGTSTIPRLSVFRSNKYIYAQLIDDEKGATLVSLTDHESKAKTKIARATDTGKTLAEKAIKKKITKVVFDRGGFAYHGRVRAVAEGVREGGISC